MNTTATRSTTRRISVAVAIAAVCATTACGGGQGPDQAHLGQPAVESTSPPIQPELVACGPGRRPPRMPWAGRVWRHPRVELVG